MTEKNNRAEELSKFSVKELVFRVEGADPGDFISYDESKCSGCGDCTLVCSVNIWGMQEGKAILSSRYKDLCLECAACYAICEQDAIDFIYPSGGAGIIIRHG